MANTKRQNPYAGTDGNFLLQLVIINLCIAIFIFYSPNHKLLMGIIGGNVGSVINYFVPPRSSLKSLIYRMIVGSILVAIYFFIRHK